jgi:hypothetical protein
MSGESKRRENDCNNSTRVTAPGITASTPITKQGEFVMLGFRLTAAVIAVWVVALSAKGIQANALRYYEPFDYPDGATLQTENGGQGFTTQWTGDANNAVVAPGMTYTDSKGNSLPTSGNRVIEYKFFALSNRNLSGLGASGTSTWFSFIMQSYIASDFGTVQFRNTNGPGQTIYYIGRVNGSTKYTIVMRDIDATQYRADTTNSIGVDQKVFFTGRIDSGTTTDNVHIWLNPDLYNGTPSDSAANLVLANVPHVALNNLVLQNGTDTQGNTSIDEIRIGLDYNSVVPEPVALGLLPLCALFLARPRRRAVA